MNKQEIDQAITQAISEAVSSELLHAHGTVYSIERSTADLNLDKLNDAYKDFQRQYARDIWWALVEKYGHTRMLATGREESIQAIEAQLDLDKQFRPTWLIVSKHAPQEHGLVFFKCICLCHGDGQAHEIGRFETHSGNWCCSCSAYEDV